MDYIGNPAPTDDFLLPFLRTPGASFVLGFTKREGSSVYCEDNLGHSFTIFGTPYITSTNDQPGYGVPYMVFNGTTDYLTAADAPWNDVQDDFTLIMVAYLVSNAARQALVNKWPSGGDNQMRFDIAYSSTTTSRFEVSNDGTTSFSIQSANTTGAWGLYAGRYTRSSEVKIWVPGNTSVNTTSIPATLHDSSQALYIGNGPANNYYSGYLAMVGLYRGLVSNNRMEEFRRHIIRWGLT